MRTPRRLATLPRVRLAPATFPLMLPTLVEEVPRGPGWLFELKWDGVRVLALRAGGRVELWARSGARVTDRYPEIAAALVPLGGGDFALDGEVVALDDEGRPSFERLQQRMHLVRDVARAAARVPATAYFYDCLALVGRDVRGLPLADRKALLRELLPAHGTVRYADHVEGDGAAFLDAACKAGLEGMVAKRADARYLAGRRAEWRKIKCVKRQEFVIGGWTDPKGTRAVLGAVHLGVYDGDALVYAGRAGSGLDRARLDELAARLRPLATERCPFTRGTPPRGPEHHWVRPELVCEVRFSEWTSEGLVRHPVYLGLRADRRAREVCAERPATLRS
ncbi:MAG TPA: non-homologous end-joining DNA ligase [Candidatus Limnocylindria bacterium]|jgi:bifunctional non-homologous end joining protein LigD|nr:non-homologous end-joining DNA ligase [Candidatus Limnocylindria bacterium]